MASRHPRQAAIVEGATHVDYLTCDRRANGIARELVGSAVTGRVCLFFQHKLPAIVAMFGAARSGLAYVVLDAGDPEDRLRFIVADCGPGVLLTEAALVARARAIVPAGCAVVDVATMGGDDDGRGLPEVEPQTPLYCAYTSGSTGRPKGTLQTHANALFFFDAYARSLAIGPGDRMSLLFTLSFNAANTDILSGLCNGATLCCFDLRSDGVPALAGWLDRERVTVLHAIPTVVREMARRLPPDRVMPYLRALDFGGEAVIARDIALFRAHLPPQCLIVNQLACTEVGLIAQHRLDHHSVPPAGSIVPVGRCPPGVRVTIRRDDGSIAAPNEVGEMYVSSAHVSPGYWRRPELDAAAFADDPDIPGSRTYRSGDLGRIDDSGVLHFAGRRGSRIKLRGHTIDLVEIEAALAECTGVERAAVRAVASQPGADPDRLFAYAQVTRDAGVSPAALRDELATRIPAYMLPAGYALLDALPVTASGKVDRSALDALALPRLGADREVDPPVDEVEREIAKMFELLLEVAPVARDDDFFFLGGDSLMAADLEERLMHAFGVRVGGFHRDATVETLAGRVRAMRSAANGVRAPLPLLVPLWRQGGEVPLFIVHGRLGQAFVSPHFMQLLGDAQPVWAFQVRGLDGLAPPHATIEEMAVEYVAAMRRERPHGPYFIAAFCAGAYVAGGMANLLRSAGETVLPLLLIDPPFRLMTQRFVEMGSAQVAERVRERQRAGRAADLAPTGASLRAAATAAMAFEAALARYEPRPYAGAAYMLSSRHRIAAVDGGVLERTFAGPVERFEVGTTHRDVLDARNPSFVRALVHCVERIRAEARAPAAISAVAQ